MRSMNAIERKFYDAFDQWCIKNNMAFNIPNKEKNLNPQSVIGIYRVDFRLGDVVIEIDGHESHKTKEQREYDYKKDRYLIRNGYVVVRFMGTEVFLDPVACWDEIFKLLDARTIREDEEFEKIKAALIAERLLD